MKTPNNKDGELSDLSGENKYPSNNKWTEIMVENMIMSTSEVGMTLDVQESSIRLCTGEKTIEMLVKSSDKVQILVNGNPQAEMSPVRTLEKIGEKLEEKEIASQKQVQKILEGKDENFFSGFTTLLTLLKLTLILKERKKKASATNNSRKYEKNKDHQMGIYF